MDVVKFGVNLARLRMAKGMSAYELSSQLGKAPSYIHKVESGKVNIGIKMIFEVCDCLDIQPKKLFE